MVMWICGSLRRSRRRRRRRRRGVGQSSETCSQWSAGDRGLSLVSMVLPAVGGKLKPAAELSRAAFNEAQEVGAKAGVQDADRLQRPEGEKK